VRAILSLASSLHLNAVAEGVESADEAAQLVALRCQVAQGYLFSPAVPAGEAAGHFGKLFHPPSTKTRRRRRR